MILALLALLVLALYRAGRIIVLAVRVQRSRRRLVEARRLAREDAARRLAAEAAAQDYRDLHGRP